ncbi:MAG: hypothetical protein K2X77_26005 [Candidatus Obscuribacterales bacterium]|nr:hypothetical protein [Candidatus Obscuribacterales bacterium]
MTVLPDSLEEELEQFIGRRVAEGFDSEEDIVEGALEYFEHDFPGDNLPEVAARLTEEAIKKHLDNEKTWINSTDCDKLDVVFDQLEGEGIVARQNFTCCQTCGHCEIWEEVEQTRQERPVSGYVFYHQQDTERACDEGILYLAYGATDNTDEAAIKVARRATEVCQNNGFKVDWNGSLDKRICLVNFDWRRRRRNA